MVTQQMQTNFFLVLLAIAMIVAAFVYAPFAQVLAMPAITSVMLSQIYKNALKLFKGHENIAALTTTLVLLTMIVVPVLLIGGQVAEETASLYKAISLQQDTFFTQLEKSVNEFASVALPGIQFNINDTVKQVLAFVSSRLGSIFSGIVAVIGGIFLWLIATFYLLKDGGRFADKIIKLSPLRDDYDQVIFHRMSMAIHSVVKGQLLVASIQGAMTGLGFAVLGVPSPALWGVVAAFSALIPGLGTSLVLIPGIIYLFATGQPIQATILSMWGVFAVGVIDNLLGPTLVGKGADIHPLLILFAVLGGFVFYGPLGFILGPLTISFLIALFDIYRYVILKEKIHVTHLK
ncbi:MAG: AI-2E family transporter [Candidatus Magasanikbacteria bacterium]|nr:AI-2E family transporter [Candidatus Magasanikbacteria bacterium]